MRERVMMEENQISPELTALEREVLETAILGHAKVSELAAQLDAATVIARTPSGVGFVTKLQIPEALSIGDKQEVNDLPAVLAEHPALPSGAEFIFQVKAGRLNCIEAFCFEGMWPTNESLFRVSSKS
jgi:hypothetical protein